MAIRLAGQFVITSGGTGTFAGGVTGVQGNFIDVSLQSKSESDIAVNDYVFVPLPDQSVWRWRITAVNGTSPLNIDVVFDDDPTNWPVAFNSTPILGGVTGAISSPRENLGPNFVASFSTYQIAESITAAMATTNDFEEAGSGSDSNYALNDLTADDIRTHVWTTFDQNETFTTGVFNQTFISGTDSHIFENSATNFSSDTTSTASVSVIDQTDNVISLNVTDIATSDIAILGVTNNSVGMSFIDDGTGTNVELILQNNGGGEPQVFIKTNDVANAVAVAGGCLALSDPVTGEVEFHAPVCNIPEVDVIDSDLGTPSITIIVQGDFIAAWRHRVTGRNTGGSVVSTALSANIVTTSIYDDTLDTWNNSQVIGLGSIDLNQPITIRIEYTSVNGDSCGPIWYPFVRN